MADSTEQAFLTIGVPQEQAGEFARRFDAIVEQANANKSWVPPTTTAKVPAEAMLEEMVPPDETPLEHLKEQMAEVQLQIDEMQAGIDEQTRLMKEAHSALDIFRRTGSHPEAPTIERWGEMMLLRDASERVSYRDWAIEQMESEFWEHRAPVERFVLLKSNYSRDLEEVRAKLRRAQYDYQNKSDKMAEIREDLERLAKEQRPKRPSWPRAEADALWEEVITSLWCQRWLFFNTVRVGAQIATQNRYCDCDSPNDDNREPQECPGFTAYLDLEARVFTFEAREEDDGRSCYQISEKGYPQEVKELRISLTAPESLQLDKLTPEDIPRLFSQSAFQQTMERFLR